MSMRTQREAMVTSSGGTSSASTTNTVPGAGSSMAFNRMGALRTTRWNSSRTRTLRAPSMGERLARSTMSRACSAVIHGPVRSVTTRSGWVSARARRRWRSASAPEDPAESSAAANARANARLPLPRGPTSR